MDNYRIAELIDRLDSESWYIRQREAVDPLIEIGCPAVPALLAALQAKPHRKAIISYILYQIDHSSLDRALPVLLEELRMDVEWGFGEAAWALAEMGPAARSAVPHLIDILHDDGARTGSRVLKRRVGRWYVCFAVELPDAEPVPNHGPAVGIDVGLKSLLALSDGTLYDNPRRLRTGSHPGRAQLVHGEAIWTGVPSCGGCRRASTHSLRSTGRWR